MSKGNINVIINDGSKKCMADVYYVLGLHPNLLSMWQLSNQGYDIKIKREICAIRNPYHNLIAKVKMSFDHPFP